MSQKTYTRYHQLVYEKRGPAKKCVFGCHAQYYYWANIMGNYDDPMDYVEMCASCHKSFDNNQVWEFKCGHAKIPSNIRFRKRTDKPGNPIHVQCKHCTKKKS